MRQVASGPRLSTGHVFDGLDAGDFADFSLPLPWGLSAVFSLAGDESLVALPAESLPAESLDVPVLPDDSEDEDSDPDDPDPDDPDPDEPDPDDSDPDDSDPERESVR